MNIVFRRTKRGTTYQLTKYNTYYSGNPFIANLARMCLKNLETKNHVDRKLRTTVGSCSEERQDTSIILKDMDGDI